MREMRCRMQQLQHTHLILHERESHVWGGGETPRREGGSDPDCASPRYIGLQEPSLKKKLKALYIFLFMYNIPSTSIALLLLTAVIVSTVGAVYSLLARFPAGLYPPKKKVSTIRTRTFFQLSHFDYLFFFLPYEFSLPPVFNRYSLLLSCVCMCVCIRSL